MSSVVGEKSPEGASADMREIGYCAVRSWDSTGQSEKLLERSPRCFVQNSLHCGNKEMDKGVVAVSPGQQLG